MRARLNANARQMRYNLLEPNATCMLHAHHTVSGAPFHLLTKPRAAQVQVKAGSVVLPG